LKLVVYFRFYFLPIVQIFRQLHFLHFQTVFALIAAFCLLPIPQLPTQFSVLALHVRVEKNSDGIIAQL